MHPGLWTDSVQRRANPSYGALLRDNPCVLTGLQIAGMFPNGIWIEKRAEFGGGNLTLSSLSCANDAGVSFTEIADVLEEIYQDVNEQQ